MNLKNPNYFELKSSSILLRQTQPVTAVLVDEKFSHSWASISQHKYFTKNPLSPLSSLLFRFASVPPLKFWLKAGPVPRPETKRLKMRRRRSVALLLPTGLVTLHCSYWGSNELPGSGNTGLVKLSWSPGSKRPFSASAECWTATLCV